MITKVLMPKLGLTMMEGKVVKWLKAEGERVSRGDALIEVMTDKVTTEVESPGEGILRKIIVLEGMTVPVGTVIGLIAEQSDDISTVLAEVGLGMSPGGAAACDGATQASAAEGGVTIPDSGATAVAASAGGVRASPAVRRLAKELGIDLFKVKGSGPGGRIQEEDVKAAAKEWAQATGQVKATPLARSVAEKEGVELNAVLGTGPHGRITAQDVLAAATGAGSPKTTPGQPVEAAESKFVPVEGLRRITADRMSESARLTARVTLVAEARLAVLKAFKAKMEPLVKAKAGVGLTYTDLIVWASAQALKRHPNANCSFLGDRIEMKPKINVGIAVDTPAGLMVPVVKDAGNKTIAEIAAERSRLVEGARSGKLSPDDLQGGTFTVTNLGTYGVAFFTPIIRLPEATILGVGQIADRPVVVDGTIVAMPTVYLSLAFDHRVIDGAPAARFLKSIVEIVEEPYSALI